MTFDKWVKEQPKGIPFALLIEGYAVTKAEQAARMAVEYLISMDYKSINWSSETELINAAVKHAISEGTK
jgi:hypothetical protein